MNADALAKRFFTFDTGLNGLLGFSITLFPAWVNELIMTDNTLPPGPFRIIGAGFLLFFAWQITIIRRGTYSRKTMRFAGWMALLPFAGLTAAMLFLPLPLKPAWRDILWAGDFYMLMLGGLYFASAEGTQAEPRA